MKTRTLRIAAFAFAAVLLSLPATASGTFPGVNGKIEFVSGRAAGDGDADIYILDGPADLSLGSSTDLITGQHRHPAWSADGRFLTFALRFGGDDDLFVSDTKLGSTVILGSGSADGVLEDHPTFSPDGSMIAYESEVTNGSNQEDILVGPADGTGTTINLTNGPGAGDDALVEQTPVWSPDGQFIYYARKTNAAATDLDIMREPADNSGTPSSLLDANSAQVEWQPDISPDGTKLCFTRGPLGSAAADVMTINIDGSGDPIEVSANDDATPIADYDCAWSPDGKTLVWTRGAFSAGDLQFAPSNGSGPITPYGNNDATTFDGNLDWARAQNKCDGQLVTILGTPGSDDLDGTSGKDVAVLLGGNDRFIGKGGNDVICGGDKNDKLFGGPGKDKILGQSGNDKLRGGDGKDELGGGSGKDKCNGGPGKDKASGCEKKVGI